MRYPSMLRALAAFHLALLATGCSQAGVPATAANDPPTALRATMGDYQLLDLAACTKPGVKPPAPIPETERTYSFERRFLDLDGSGRCVIMDFWIARLGGSDAAGMRKLQSRFLRAVGGKWQPFDAELTYFPYALKARRDNMIYLIDAPVEDDIGDSMALQTGTPQLFVAAAWQSEDKESRARLNLKPVEEGRAEKLLALAALLEQRIATAGVKNADRERIALLRRTAR